MTTSSAYLQLLADMADLHRRKSAGYSGADNPDPWANFRRAERLGVQASTGALVRLLDKISRVETLLRDPSSEQVGEAIEDTLIDAAAYCLITVCLRREEAAGGPVREPDPAIVRALAILEVPHKHDWRPDLVHCGQEQDAISVLREAVS